MRSKHLTNCVFPREACVPLLKRAFCLYSVTQGQSHQVFQPPYKSREDKNGWIFADGIFRSIFFNDKLGFVIEISPILDFVTESPSSTTLSLAHSSTGQQVTVCII